MNNCTVLLAEDEPALGMIIKESLETRGFTVHHYKDGDKASSGYNEVNPDILVLDVMMPKKDGFTLAQEIRRENKEIPILFLTAKSQVEDVVNGFKIGGNDYLKKPFSMEELIVRIKALTTSSKTHTASTTFTVGSYTFNFPKQRLSFKDNEVVKLTHREAHLLYHLLQNKNQVLDRTYILKKLWGTDDFFAGRSMDVFITKLRKKLSQDNSIEIVNVRGYGYKLIAP